MTRTQSILEIRFSPDPSFIDYRGRWAAALGKGLGVTKWRVTQDRIEVFSEDKKLKAFVSVRNVGITIWDEPTTSFFRDKAGQFLKAAFSLENFPNVLAVERIGVRQMRYMQDIDDMDGLLKKYSELSVGTEIMDLIPTRKGQEDVGTVIITDTDAGKMRIHSGPITPLEKASPMQDHPERQDFGDSGFLTDIDLFDSAEGKHNEKKLRNLVTSADRTIKGLTDEIFVKLGLAD